MKNILSAINLVKSYPESKQTVLKNISLDLHEGKNYCFIGSNGAGKTTLLKALAGLIDLDSGQIFYHSEILKSPSEKLVAGHPNIKFLSQDASLYPKMTVYENIRYELKANNIEYVEERASELLQLCGLSGHEMKYPSQLSGGQKQRTALAKAIADHPEVIILDEPFSNADLVQKMHLRKTLNKIFKNSNTTMLFSSHDISDAFSLADKIYCLKDGELVQEGPPIDIFNEPKNEYVANLGGVCNFFKNENLNSQNTANPSKTCVRANDLTISNSRKYDIKGRILESYFLGPDYEYTLITETCENIIFYSKEKIDNGQLVYLKVSEGKTIYF